jgi:hypothetical protein
MLGTNTQKRLELLLRGYLAAALIVSLVTGAAYFRLLGSASDNFCRTNARALPSTIRMCLARSWRCRSPGVLVHAGRSPGRALRPDAADHPGGPVPHLFSRGAWAQFAFAGTLLMLATFVTSRSAGERFRIVLIAMGGVLVVAVLVTALLSIEQVSELFTGGVSGSLARRTTSA